MAARKKKAKKKDELAVLIKAWLKNRKVGALLAKGKIDDALEIVGIKNARLSAALKKIDPKEIGGILRAINRVPGGIKPMG